MDVETGAILWTYHGNPDPKGGSPIGRASRGVALGDGKVFVGHTDAQLAALDQRTGKVIWKIPAERWQDGFAITAAPLYYDGLVIIGFNGGEMGTRGRLKAYRREDRQADAGRSTRCPAPGELGHETWPQDSDAWTRGGARHLADARRRSGARARSTSRRAIPGPICTAACVPATICSPCPIVAIEAKTGKYRWHFQQVHHDIWDYDSPNPVVLFDAPDRRQAAQRARRSVEDGLGVHPRSRDRQAAHRHRREGRCRRSRGRPPRRRSRIRSAMRSCRRRSTSCRKARASMPNGAAAEQGPHLHAVLDRRRSW